MNTNETDGATARPWRRNGNVIGTNRLVVCSTDWRADPDSDATDIPLTKEEAEANAALIVQAVNCYDALLAVAEAASAVEGAIYDSGEHWRAMADLTAALDRLDTISVDKKQSTE